MTIVPEMRMLTRRKVRRAVCWAGAAAGAASLLGLLVSLFASVALLHDPYRFVMLQRASLEIAWQREPVGVSGRPLPMPYTGGPLWRWLPKWSEPDNVWNGRVAIRTPGEFVLPLWMPSCFGLLCAYWLLPEGPRRGVCACGYDLRGVPTRDGRVTCPECGVVTG